MKPHILIIFLLALFFKSNAQLNLTLALNTRPQPYLADWSNSVNGRVIVTLGQGNDAAIKFKSTITDQSGSIIGTTNLAAANIYQLNRLPSTNLFSLGDVLQLQNLQLNNSAQNLLQSSGRLAAGVYVFTVQVYNVRDSLITTRFATLNITAYQLPTLMMPANNSELDAHIASNIIVFRWTSLTPRTQELPTYRVQVFEVLNNQTPMQAFRSNQPVLDEVAIKGTTQFIWHANLPMLDTLQNRQFIWTIQTLDVNGQPIPTNDMNVQGRSEPVFFKITNQVQSTKKQLKPDFKD